MKYRKYIFLAATFFLASMAAQAQPEANEIVFSGSSSSGSSNQIYSMRVDGRGQVNLTNDPNGWHSSPSWSPDGTKIVYTGYFSIWVMNTDGSNKMELGPPNLPGYPDSPVWSPDGSKIAFNTDDGWGLGSIQVMNADGTNMTYLASGTFLNGLDWSPDGSKIAFSDLLNIYVMNADGTNQINITNSGANPEWSPDGTKIAFTSWRDGNHEIYVMNPDGSNQVRITNSPAHDSSPSWSPDGTRLAFVSNRDGGGNVWGNIYVMNADGTNVVRLTQNPFGSFQPHWKRSLSPAPVSIAGRVTTSAGRGISQARVTLDDGAGNVRLALTSTFGYFMFYDVPTGKYTVSVESKGHSFASQTIGVSTSITDLDFTALENP